MDILYMFEDDTHNIDSEYCHQPTALPIFIPWDNISANHPQVHVCTIFPIFIIIYYLLYLHKLYINDGCRLQIHQAVCSELGCMARCAAATITTKIQLLAHPVLDKFGMLGRPGWEHSWEEVAPLESHVRSWADAGHHQIWQHAYHLAWGASREENRPRHLEVPSWHFTMHWLAAPCRCVTFSDRQ